MEAYITLTVSEDVIKRAQQIRAERDQRYGNIFQEAQTDLRWVGEIGELCFDRWIRMQTHLPVEWITDEAAGKPDFYIGGIPIGLKTVKRKGGILPGYTAQITAKHAQEPVEHYFFASYEFPRKRLWLLGGTTKQYFLEHSQRHGAGAQVHPNYTVRPRHEIYNFDIGLLTPPLTWVKVLQRQS